MRSAIVALALWIAASVPTRAEPRWMEHTEYLAATIPGADLLILPNTSHFAFLQDPGLFNAAMLDFLDGR